MDKSISSDLIRGHIDSIILQTLIDNDKNVQEICETVEKKSENQYRLNQATLYSSLKRLESLKYITSYWNDYSEGRRKFFKITDSGKEFINDNLSSWEFSRSIIDKLINFEEKNDKEVETKVVYVTKEVEKIVEKPIETPENLSIFDKKDEQFPVFDNNQNKNENNSSSSIEEQNFNFRTVLKELISDNVSDKKEEKQSINALHVENEQDANKPKFAETLINYKTQNGNKIDFSDLIEKSKSEGFKVRVSSVISGRKNGVLFINKLNLFSILAVFFFGLFEYLILGLGFVKNDLTPALNVFIFLLLIAFPIAFSVMYFTDKLKTTAYKVGKDGILSSVVVVFNLLIITFALNFIFDVDFSVSKNLFFYLIFPVVFYLDIVLFFVVRYFLSKNKMFIVKREYEH